MKAFTLTSLVFLSSVIFGCATGGKSILEERAGYDFTSPPMSVGAGGGIKYVPSRVPEKVIVAWLHAKELPSGDYFWGSWLSIVVAPESWELKKVEVPKGAGKRSAPKSPDKPIKGPPKRPKQG